MINNSDPGCVSDVWSRPVYLVLQCLQWWQHHPGPGVRLPRTAELLLQAGVCSVCTPGPAVLQSPAAQQLPQLQEALQCLLWAGG